MLEALVIEWRDAREAILLVNWGDPVVAKAHVHLWERLGHAEAALMAHARGLVIRPAWPAPGCMPEIQIIPPGPYVDPYRQGAEPTRAEVLAACFNPEASLDDAQRAEAPPPQGDRKP